MNWRKEYNFLILIFCIVLTLTLVNNLFNGLEENSEKKAEIMNQVNNQFLYDETGFLNIEQQQSIKKSLKSLSSNKLDFYVLLVDSIGKKDIDSYANELLSTWKLQEGKSGQGLLIYVKRTGELRIQFDENFNMFYNNDVINNIVLKEKENLENDIPEGIVNIVLEINNYLEENLKSMNLDIKEKEPK